VSTVISQTHHCHTTLTGDLDLHSIHGSCDRTLTSLPSDRFTYGSAAFAILPARHYASAGTSFGPVSVCMSVCLSQVVVLSKGMDGLSLIMFLSWRLLSTSPTLCFKEIQVSTKNKGAFLVSCFKTPDFKKFRHGISVVERAVNLARERWTLRA